MSSGEPPLAPGRPPGALKVSPEDFVVDEIPAYEPTGTGEHVFVRFTKRNRTTNDAVRAIARALGCDARAAGVAGMKDKRAVTTQTVSLQAPRGTKAADVAEKARNLALDAIQIHAATPHGHKLKTGHLSANRFDIVVRGIPAERVGEAGRALEAAGRSGVPNAFGAQRFGVEGDNTSRALAWLRGEERGPRDRRLLRLLWSSVQSTVFNAVLEERVRDGTWAQALAGDLLKLRDSGGIFLCTEPEVDAPRAERGEVSPTGPIFGPHMRWPEGGPATIERRLVGELLGDVDLTRAQSLGDGSRRALRVWVDELRWEPFAPRDPAETDPRVVCMRVRFVLPKGAYATTVLASAFGLEQAERLPSARDEAPPSEEEEEPS
jgi:tRNA pseudouridine13 synthase